MKIGGEMHSDALTIYNSHVEKAQRLNLGSKPVRIADNFAQINSVY